MRGVLPSSDNAEPHAQRYAANLNIEQFHGAASLAASSLTARPYKHFTK
jgi:hypothetical protein